MKDKPRVDWGVCDGCGLTGKLLTPFIHHPTLNTIWLCADCTLNSKEALENGQVPGILAQSIQAVFTEEV